MEFRIDRERAKEVLGRLLATQRKREYPYNLPQAQKPNIVENLPRNLPMKTREHALFLFASCYYMRGGIQSHVAFKRLSQFHEAAPLFFLPEHAENQEPAKVTEYLLSVGLGFQAKQNGRFWVENARRLVARWEGDPRLVYDGVMDYDEACRRVRNDGTKKQGGFMGFREKMVSMLTYFLLDAELIEEFSFPLPIDFHVMRLLVSHEILVFDNRDFNPYQPKVLAKLRPFLEKYARENGFSPLEMSEVLWLFSRTLCSQHPDNSSSVKERRARKSVIVPLGKPWGKNQTLTYERSCGRCPVESTCKWAVPAADYYVKGRITLRAERSRPPQLVLPLFGNGKK